MEVISAISNGSVRRLKILGTRRSVKGLAHTMILKQMKVNGHKLTYNGKLLLAFRTDKANRLITFEGHSCTEVVIDGTRYVFAQKPFETIVFAPEKDKSGNYMAILTGEGKVKLPNPFKNSNNLKISTSDNKKIPFRITNSNIELDVTRDISGKTLRIGM